MSNDSFFTFSEYMKKEYDILTASMEDYVEMIYRLSRDLGFTRIHDLAEALNVQPPSATKMVQKLAELNLVKYEKYGIVILTEEGKDTGKALLKRHSTIESFLKLLGVSESQILEETEKIEHTISNLTMSYINDFINFMKEKPEVVNEFDEYRKNKEK